MVEWIHKIVMQFQIIFVLTCQTLVLCSEHRLTCKCQTFNYAVRVYFVTFNVFNYTKMYLDTLVNVRMDLNTFAFK